MPDLRAKLQTALGARYRIIRELTGGGMSRVFLADEVGLEREVAVKVLALDLIDEARVERFRLEVLQTARLQHPTIVPLLEVGAIEEVPGHHVPYYIMPYARGESLRNRMLLDGRLSLNVTLRVLRSVFDALAFAHTHGVIHRDVKPENVFLSGTTAVLADFGIAKAVSGPGSRSGATRPGVAVGTPSYMAPEQLLDGENVGPRADLYGAGVVAYEMLAGRLPWDAQSPTDSLASQARDAFTPLLTLRPDVPESLARLIESCIAWNPERRPDSAARVLHELEATPVARTPNTTPGRVPAIEIARPRSASRRRLFRNAGVVLALCAIAVVVVRLPESDRNAVVRELSVSLPELPAGGPRSREVTEQLLHLMTAQLAPVSGLRLVGQTSVARMAADGLTSAQIADSLRAEGVDSTLVVVASRSSEGAHTLTVDLVGLRANSRSTVGGPVPISALETLPFDSLLAAVRLLAAQVVARLNLSSDAGQVASPRRADAFMAWLEGHDAAARRTPAGLREAIRHYDRAIALDSSYSQARAELANTISLTLFYRYRQRDDAYSLAARALSLADEAVTESPGLGDGYLARALVGTIAGAPTAYLETNFKAAERLSVANPFSRIFGAALLVRQGRPDEAVAMVEEEVRLDPRSAGQRVASALYSIPAGQFATTMRNGSAARRMLPDVPMLSQLELWGRLRLGGRALEDCARIPAGPYLASRALCLERTGHPSEGRALADTLFAMLTGKSGIDSTFDLSLSMTEMAMYYAARNEPDASRQWVRQAFLESPAGIDFRLMRSGFFDRSLIALSDSLQNNAWRRVSAAAARVKVSRRD